MKLNRLIQASVAALAAVVATATPSITSAHIDESLQPAADLSISAEPRASGLAWIISVKADHVLHHPLATVNHIKVRISAETLDPGVRLPGVRLNVSPINNQNDVLDWYDGFSKEWTITELPRDGTPAEAIVWPPVFPRAIRSGETTIVRVTAEVIGSHPTEPMGFQGNNTLELFYTGGLFSHGDAGIDGIAVSDRSPAVGGTTTFTVRAENEGGGYSIGGRPLGHGDFDNRQFSVEVAVELSPGLAFAGTQTPPSGTNFSATTGIWEIGTLEAGYANAESFPVMVSLTEDSLEDLPLEERCLTARITQAVPWFASDLSKRENDEATMCLGEGKERPLIINRFASALSLFDFYPCVGVNLRPCTNDDTLELVAAVGFRVLDPNEFIINIKDIPGRQSTSNPSWNDRVVVPPPSGVPGTHPRVGVEGRAAGPDRNRAGRRSTAGHPQIRLRLARVGGRRAHRHDEGGRHLF